MRLLLGLMILAASVSARAQIIFVDADATGTNNGTSWANAFPDLQDALAMASAGDEVWVAEGFYVPTSTADRSISFVLLDGISVYGGFNGTEATREERDWTLYESILSGDIRIPGDSTDNSYHVVIANNVSENTILDGLTIQNGTARGGPAPDDRGAGMLAIGGSPTIRNSRFLRNVIGSPSGGEKLGGGIYIENGNPTIEDCYFEDNGANAGGGLFLS